MRGSVILTLFIAIYFKNYSLNESMQEIWISKIWLKPGEFDLFIPRPKGRGNNKVKNEWAYHFAIFNLPRSLG